MPLGLTYLRQGRIALPRVRTLGAERIGRPPRSIAAGSAWGVANSVGSLAEARSQKAACQRLRAVPVRR
jgi:hypothetical protein